MFQSALILGVSVVYIVQHPLQNASQPPPEDNPSPEELADTNLMSKAKWCLGTTFTMTILLLFAIATMCRSLDKPGSLKVTNRYLRLLPRLSLVVLALCLPLKRSMAGSSFLAILVGVLGPVLFWEWYASLEKSGAIFEP